MTESELALACAQALYAQDNASQQLGMKIQSAEPGMAEVEMRVREDMVNGHQIAHGGLIFALADSAFAFACNSYNNNTIAQGCAIQYLKPVMLDDLLLAKAKEISRGGRTGVYDVNVYNQNQQLVATFRGNSYQIDGQVIDTAQTNKDA